jgi:6-pyruvoyltetrahydropterin/6-carboxytetrahydropterin synthase
MIICTRRIEFDAAHRIMEHESKCKMLHGHRYVVELSFGSKNLDKLGRVIDFGNVRDILESWINEHLDHNAILSCEDKKLGDAISENTGQKIYYLDENPTVENIAKHLFYDIAPKLFADYNSKIVSIKIYETPNCSTQING